MSDDRRLRAWVERLSVVAILGSVAALAVPKYASLERERVATQILTDVETLRRAVYAFYSDSAYFPVSTAGEPAPDGLVQYLPASFRFARPYGTLEYRNWAMAPRRTAATDSGATSPDSASAGPVLPDTTGGNAPADTATSLVAVAPASPTAADSVATQASASAVPATNVVGVTVTVMDGRVGAMAASKMPPRSARFVVGNLYTFLFFGT